METVERSLLFFGGDGPLILNKLSFRTLPQVAVRTSRHAVSVLLLAETMAISELVLGKLQPSFSMAQETDCTDDPDFSSRAGSALALEWAPLPVSSLSDCVCTGERCRFMLPLILIGVFRTWTADNLFDLITDEGSFLVLLFDVVSKCPDPEAWSAGCFAGLVLRKRSSEKIREGKPHDEDCESNERPTIKYSVPLSFERLRSSIFKFTFSEALPLLNTPKFSGGWA